MNKQQEYKITFQPSGRSVFALPGTLLLEAAGRAGVALQTPCGGRGTCGKSRVRIASGQCPPSPSDRQSLSAEQLEQGYRLACRAYIEGPLVVEVSPESLFGGAQQILTSHAGRSAVLNPVTRKVFFRLVPPSRDDAAADSARLASVAGDVSIPFLLLRKLPGFLRVNDWQGTAVIAGNRLIGLLPQIACDRIHFIGNAASLGAQLALLSADERALASRLSAATEHIDLSLDPEFQMEFGMAMLFSDGDVDACNDVR